MATKLLKLAFSHRDELRTAYAKNGTNLSAHAKDATDTGYTLGLKAATAPLRATETIPRLVVRGLQFLFALILVGIYGTNVRAGSANPENASPAWWFGLVVAVLACLSALVMAFAAPLGAVSRRCKMHLLFGWDLALALCWIIVFGIMMGIFHNRGDSDADEYKGASTSLQKAAAWLDLVNSLLWLVSGVYGAVKTCVSRRRDALKDRAQAELFKRFETGNGDKEAQYAQSQVSEPEPVYHHGRQHQGYNAF